MHRQSLGSPGSKLLHPHGLLILESTASVVTTVSDQASSSSLNVDDEQIRKSIKSVNKSLFKAEKYIHLIPVLTFLCFFILYLSSHHPSDKEIAQFHGFEGFSKPIGKIEELQRVIEIGKADVLALRSLRNLQEIDKRRQDPKNRLHRKIADF